MAPWNKGPGKYSDEELEELVQSASDHSWMQFHQGRDLAADGIDRFIVKGEGHHIYDIRGNRYIDGLAGLLLMNVGHGRDEIVDAISNQLRELPYANSGSFATVPGVLLAERIANHAPGDLGKVFFCNGGSEAIEIALKMARQIQYLRGFPKKTKIIARHPTYHGSTWAAMSLTSPASYKGIFEPLMQQVRHVQAPYCYRCPWGLRSGNATTDEGLPSGCCRQPARELERLIEFEGAETIAAFIGTPAFSGAQLPPPDYWSEVREICNRHDILLIADEIICGFGRMGTWFGMERFGIVPDLMAIAKALTGGYLPGGAVVARTQWAELFEEKQENVFLHGVTYGGHPGVMAAGLATLDIMEREQLVERSERVGRYLYEQARARLLGKHEMVGDVAGGLGLITYIELVLDRETKQKPSSVFPEFSKSLVKKLRDRGLITRAGDVISLSPPLTISERDVDEIIDILDDALSAQAEEFPPNAA